MHAADPAGVLHPPLCRLDTDAAETSGSSKGASRSGISTIVTRVPNIHRPSVPALDQQVRCAPTDCLATFPVSTADRVCDVNDVYQLGVIRRIREGRGEMGDVTVAVKETAAAPSP